MKRITIALVCLSVEAFADGGANSQEGSLNTYNNGSTVSSNNTTTDTSTTNHYNGAWVVK